MFPSATLQQNEASYNLQVSHQAPSRWNEELTFFINGETIPEFTKLTYGSGSTCIDVSKLLIDRKASVNIEVLNSDGDLVTARVLTLKTSYQSFYAMTQEDGKTSNVFFEWTEESAKRKFWFSVVNLAPSQSKDEEATFWVDDEVLTEDLGFGKGSDLYKAVAGVYAFTASNSSSVLANETWRFHPGNLYTIILNSIPGTTDRFQLFKLLNWQTDHDQSRLRAVQSVPTEDLSIWIGEEEKPLWKKLDYKTVTEYESIDAIRTSIYVSRSSKKPKDPSLVIGLQSFGMYSLLITGYPDQDVPIEVTVVKDQNYAPLYTEYNHRVVYLSPQDSPVQVFLNDQDLGTVARGQATEYAADTPRDTATNVTLFNDEFVVQNAIDEDEFQGGSVYSSFVMGVYGASKHELTLITTLDISPSGIEKVNDDQSNRRFSNDGKALDEDNQNGNNNVFTEDMTEVIQGAAVFGGLVLTLGFLMTRITARKKKVADTSSKDVELSV